MYERSAIVLEKYIEKILRLNKTYNLKKNSENYTELISELENFQITTDKDAKVIQEFDDTVKKIEDIQREQEKLYKANRRLEDDRIQLFGELGEDYKVLDTKLKKIEDNLEKNNSQITKLREEFIKNLQDFAQKQKDRNKCDKERRISEARIIKYREEIHAEFNEIDVQDMLNLKDFIASEKEQVRQEALEIMTKNGKSEKVPFNQDVLRKAANNRIDIAEKEAGCYIAIYEKMKKLLAEPDNESIKLEKYKKILKETSVKLAFLKAQKEYIFGFLDYERMTAISSSTKAHKKVMDDACNNFELDMIQIKNLYELLLKEIGNKGTQKSYKELYNKNYLKSIEDKEKNFEEEANNVNLKSGTLINSNYWRIEGIKNIYTVFQQEVSKNFGKDLSEYRIEGIEIDDGENNETEETYNEEDYDDEYEEDYEEYEDDDDVEEYDDEEEYEEDDDDEYEDDDDVEEYEEEDDEYEEYDDEEEYEEDDDVEEYEDEDEYEDDDDEYEDEDDADDYEDDDDDDDEEEYEDEYEDDDEEDEYEEDDDEEEYEEEYEEDDDEDNEDEEDEEEEGEEIDSEDLDNIIKNSRKQALQKNSKTSKTSKTSKSAKTARATKTSKSAKATKETKTTKTNKTSKNTKTAKTPAKVATKASAKTTKASKNTNTKTAKHAKTTNKQVNKPNNKDKGLFNKFFKK